jgi:histidine ammonia-lyase
MMAQVTAAALLADSRILSHPASVDNVPTDGGKEDHVSMGMTAAVKLRGVVENTEYALAIELLAGAEGIEHRAPLKPGLGVLRACEAVRSLTPRLTHDRALAEDFERIAEAIRQGKFDF